MTKEQAETASISTRVQDASTGARGTIGITGEGYVKVDWDKPPRDMYNREELQSLDLIGAVVANKNYSH